MCLPCLCACAPPSLPPRTPCQPVGREAATLCEAVGTVMYMAICSYVCIYCVMYLLYTYNVYIYIYMQNCGPELEIFRSRPQRVRVGSAASACGSRRHQGENTHIMQYNTISYNIICIYIYIYIHYVCVFARQAAARRVAGDAAACQGLSAGRHSKVQ